MISLILLICETNWNDWDGKSIIIKTKGKIPNVLINYEIQTLRIKNAYRVFLSNPSIEKANELLKTLNKDENIIYSEPTIIYKTFYEPNDPLYNKQWGLYVMYLNYAWNISKGNNTKVCVIDTGIDFYHEDLSENFIEGYDEVDDDYDISPPVASESHGTHVAGTILALMDNNRGISGVSPNSKLLGCRAFTNSGGASSDISNCIIWCISKGARVINMSFGSSSESQIIKEAIDSAYNKNIIMVAAAGNSGNYGVSYPAKYDNVISVGALDKDGKKANFSNYGPELDFVAPGVEILSTVPYTNQYSFSQGTSMAAPHISGIVALILSINPNLSFNDVYNILKSSSIDIGSNGKDDYYGWGLVHAQRALLNTPQPTFSNSDFQDVEMKVFKNFVKIKSEVRFEVYSVQGEKIYSGNYFEGILNKGIYILKVGKTVKKFLVH